jgi:hypothetical protein
MIGVSTVWAAASMLVVGLRGSLENPWATLDGSQAMVRGPKIFFLLCYVLMTLSIFAGLHLKSLGCSLRLFSGLCLTV